MTTRNAAVTAAGWAGVSSATAAALVIWLLLMRPLDVADAVGGHDLAGLALLAFETLRDLTFRLLNLL
jgi:hypothetical protein